MTELPSGTVTFLFSDIEGSTRLVKLLRERYVEVLAEHRRIVRAAVQEAGGHEIGRQGDALFVVFRRAGDAVRAAVEIQLALAAATYPAGAQVRVRIGLHTGEAALDDDDYHGLAVHRAARICSAGHGGQILLSQSTCSVLEDDTLPDVRLLDLGRHSLKDFDRPERIYQVAADGLLHEFPPLKTTDADPLEEDAAPAVPPPGGLGLAAVRLRWRAELRTRWLAWLALAALVGLAGGIVFAAAAGARRTETAYPRFLRAYNAADVALPDDGQVGSGVNLRAVERLPQVAEAARGSYFYMQEAFVALAAADERIGTSINRFKILDGRRPNPRRIGEVAVSFAVANRLGLDVGKSFPLFEPPDAAKAARFGVPNPLLTVVAIVASPGAFPPQYPGGQPVIYLTPAFYRKIAHPHLTERDSLYVRLKRGQADLPAFTAEIERRAPGGALIASQRYATVATQRSLHLQAVALWVFAGLTGLVALLVLAQTLARQTFLESTEYPTLRALGMTRVQLWLLGMARAVAIGAVGAGLAVGLAFLLSPLLPIGLARTAEPDPGFAFDALATGIGAGAVIVLVALLAAVPAVRATRLAGNALGTAEVAGRGRPSPLVSSLARLGVPPTLVAGARMALEPGRGRTAVPVRTTLAGVTLGLAALAGALTFGASLTHLLDTPRLYGWNWDEVVTTYGADPNPDLDPHREAIAAVRGIESASIGSSGVPLVVGDANSIEGSALALAPVKGSVLPPLLAGRPPAAADEIALAAVTMRRAGIGLGDTVEVRIPGFPQKRVAVVGRVVIPPLVGGDTRLGQGGLLTLEGLNRLAPPDEGYALATDLLLRLSPGADRRRVLADLRRDAWPRSPPNAEEQVPFEVVRREEPSDIVNFGRVDNLPVLLAGVLALLAAATLAHLLLSAIRRRRRDLAVLKTIGFVRRQVLATVAWQATTLATVALLIGVPLGIAAGRWSWAVFADRLGVVREPVIPLASVLILVPATLLVANLIAVLPARMAARTRPAAVLRTE